MEKLEKQLITPQIAESMLKLNIANNRPISMATINQYTIDMLQEKWLSTGDSIKFDNEGNLSDGQHRLHAIVKSGVSIEMWVCTNLNKEALKFIDTGRKRSAADLLHMSNIGGGYATDLVSVARKIIAWQRDKEAVLSNMQSGRGMSMKGSLSNHQILEFCQNNNVLDHAIFGKNLYSRTPVKLMSSADLGFLHWLFSQISKEKAEEFLTKLALKDNVPHNSPIACLYNRILSSKDSLTPITKMKLIFHAWNLWREDKTALMLKVGKMETLPELV
jgi:hypothetical protein